MLFLQSNEQWLNLNLKLHRILPQTTSLTRSMVVKTDGQYQIRWKFQHQRLSLVAMGEKVEVASDAWIRVDAARNVVDNILESGETAYGIIRFGALVSASISPEV